MYKQNNETNKTTGTDRTVYIVCTYMTTILLQSIWMCYVFFITYYVRY